jgi:hypothetical protein
MKKVEQVSHIPDSSDRENEHGRSLQEERNDDVPTATIEAAIGELPLLAGLVAVANVAAVYLIIRRTADAVSGLRGVRGSRGET